MRPRHALLLPACLLALTGSAYAGNAVFGDVRVGWTSPPQVINVQNVGNSGLKVSQLVLDAGPMGGGNPGDFVLDRSMIPDGTVIPAMGQLPITVSFKPSMPGGRSARVVIVSDDPNTPAMYITLLGNGTMARPMAAPFNIDFGPQTLYQASKPSSVTFTNLGTAPYSITKVDFQGFNKDWFRLSAMVVFPVTVAPNASVNIDLFALPLSLGLGTGTVTFSTDDPVWSRFDVPVKVTGVAPIVKVTPAQGDFGIIGVLAWSTKMFTIENVGTDVLHIRDFKLVDPMQCECFQVNNAPMPDMNGNWPSILPGGRINFSVLFSPPRMDDFKAEITVDTDDPNMRHIHIPLAGAGGQVKTADVTPVMLNFGTVLAGMISVPETVTITSISGPELNIASVKLSGSNPNNFYLDDPGSFTLVAGQSKVLTVSYRPVAAGMHAAALVITPMGFSPAQVKLSGVAVYGVTGHCPPPVLDFDAAFVSGIPIGTEESLEAGFQLPSNGIAVSIDRVAIAGSPDFRVEQPPKLNLAPGEKGSFKVYFRPSDSETMSATVSLFVRGVNNPLCPPMLVRGTGVYREPVEPLPIDGGCSMAASRPVRTVPLALIAILAITIVVRRRERAAN